MKITDERPTTMKKKYEELNCGDVFMINGHTIMKTDVKGASHVQGIDLKTGTWATMDKDAMCEPLDVELIIRGVIK